MVVMFLGYKPYLISTIVDAFISSFILGVGYKPYLISTIVDTISEVYYRLGYKPYLISTIVDRKQAEQSRVARL